MKTPLAFASIVFLAALSGLAGGALGDDAAPAAPQKKFRLGVEIKANVRSSAYEEFKLSFPFPPSFIPPDRGTSGEISNVALIGEADFTPDISARLRIHFLDLYNRNPTSSDDRVF